LTLIPELRFENASQNIFYDKTGNGTKTSANVLMAAVYAF
jgi:hypothetical protein